MTGARDRMVEMKVARLAVDPMNNMPIVVLRDEPGREVVPVWIGMVEAAAIAALVEGIRLRRPSTYDLMMSILGEGGMRVLRVEIRDLRNETFFATIMLERAGATVELDARPSDAMAIALRSGAPIFVARRVVEKTRGFHHLGDEIEEEPALVPGLCTVEPGEGDRRTDLLSLLPDEDFGKWKM